MPTDDDFRLDTPKGSGVRFVRRTFDGVEVERSRLGTYTLDEARALHASLGRVIATAEANEVSEREHARGRLLAERDGLRRQLEAVDAELGS